MATVQPAIPVQDNASFRGILKEDFRYASREGTATGDSVNGWFDRLMLQSGIRTAPGLWLGLCLLSALALGGLMFLLTEQLVPAVLFALIGLALPLIAAMIMRSRRQKKITEQLPAVAEELARAARTGRNVESAFRMVAGDTPSPLGDELRESARRADLGIDLASALRDLPDRTGVPTLMMFASAIGVHQDTGGDLIQVLERLATAVRDRLHFVSRLRAATIASRMGAIMMLVIPPIIVGVFLFLNPNHLTELLSSFWGRLSLWLGIGLQIVGAFFVFRILRTSARF